VKKEGDILNEVEREMRRELRAILSDAQAAAVVEKVTSELRLRWGGTKHYVRDATSPHIRNRHIIRDWQKQRKNGQDNRKLLAAKYQVPVQTINRVISRYLQNLRHPNQGFGDDTWNL